MRSPRVMRRTPSWPVSPLIRATPCSSRNRRVYPRRSFRIFVPRETQVHDRWSWVSTVATVLSRDASESTWRAVTARSELLFRVSAGRLEYGHWLADMNDGGGRLLGEGCHFIDFACWVIGLMPDDVMCRLPADGDVALGGRQRFSPVFSPSARARSRRLSTAQKMRLKLGRSMLRHTAAGARQSSTTSSPLRFTGMGDARLGCEDAVRTRDTLLRRS